LPLKVAPERVVLYAYALAYLVAPTTFASANVVAFVAGLPVAVKLAGKAILAAPFAFHSLNGIRHLGWDLGYCECLRRHMDPLLNTLAVLTLKGAYRSGYTVLGATAVSTVALLLM
jgi:succinate dehydrogenase (ubiquinone) cytochrome b560 subunit